eukprot:gene18083-biopygen15954
MLGKWNSAWREIKSVLAPKKLVIAKVKAGQRNISPRARAAVKERSRARTAHLKAKTPDSRARYKAARKAETFAIRQDSASYIEQRRREAGSNLKECWKLRKELLGQARSTPPQPAASAAEANTFFIEKPRRVQRTTLYAPLAQVTKRVGKTATHFTPVTSAEVCSALKRSRTTWSVGLDEVPMAILKKVKDTVAPYLAAISNAIIREQEWPRCWKTAKVCAIWKNKGSRREVKTYRPI